MRLGAALTLEYGKPLDSSERKSNGQYPVYGANGQKDRSDRFLVDEETIIVGRKGSAGELNLTEERFWPLDVTYFVRFDVGTFERKFLYYLLQTFELPSMAKGIKPGLNRNEVYDLVATIPPVDEQRRVSRILDEAFEGIATAKANAERNVANARALFDSYLDSVFLTELNSWKSVALGAVAEFRNGVNFTKNSRGESIRIVGVKDFKGNLRAPLESTEWVTTDGEIPPTDLLKENDILFVRSNGSIDLIGRCLLVGEVSERIVHSGFTIRARLQSRSVIPQFLAEFLRAGRTRQKLIDSGIGTNIKSLNQGSLAALQIPYPSQSEQSSIVNRIEAIRGQIGQLESIMDRKLAALDALKKSLLHRAFTGQL